MEGHRFRRLHRFAHDLPRLAGKAGRDVYSDDRQMGCVDLPDPFQGQAGKGPVKPGAEKGIHDLRRLGRKGLQCRQFTQLHPRAQGLKQLPVCKGVAL